MNIYKSLNEVIKYIEDNLTNHISYKKISKIFATNESTMQRFFSLITGMSLSEYIRNRRLTVAVNDIKNGEKLIDIALKYGYSSEISFSRAFKKMHGILPSKVRKSNIEFNMQVVLKFDEIESKNNISYRIENMDEKTLYGIKKLIDIKSIPIVAENLWKDVKSEIPEFLDSDSRYGVICNLNSKFYYYCALEKEYINSEKIVIPKSKWFVLKCDSNDSLKIKKLFDIAYNEYIPSANFNIKYNYAIEKYSNDKTEIYIMID